MDHQASYASDYGEPLEDSDLPIKWFAIRIISKSIEEVNGEEDLQMNGS